MYIIGPSKCLCLRLVIDLLIYIHIYIYMHMNFYICTNLQVQARRCSLPIFWHFCSDLLGSIGDEICRSRNGRRFKTFPFFCIKPDVGQQTKPWRKTRGSMEGTTRNTRSESTYHLYCKVHVLGGKTFLTSISSWLHFHAFFVFRAVARQTKTVPFPIPAIKWRPFVGGAACCMLFDGSLRGWRYADLPFMQAGPPKSDWDG